MQINNTTTRGDVLGAGNDFKVYYVFRNSLSLTHTHTVNPKPNYNGSRLSFAVNADR